MEPWISSLFGSQGAAARAVRWSLELTYLHVAGNLLLAASLLFISVVLLTRLVSTTSTQREGGDRGIRALLVLGCVAMLAAGLEHFASFFDLWTPMSGVEGLLKVVTALLVIGCAVLLWRHLPRLRQSQGRLETEIAAHLMTKEELADARSELKSRIASHKRQLGEVEKRFEIALRNSPITVFTQDADMRFTWVHNPPFGLAPEALLGKSDEEVFPPTAAAKIMVAKRAAIESLKPQELEIDFELAGEQRSLYLRIEPLKDPAGTISVAVDVSHRRAQEVQLRLLLRELTHRSKNLLAVINAIARQTASRTSSVTDFIDNFNARLIAIGAAHDLLVADDWKGAPLKSLVEAELSARGDGALDRIDIEGADVMLKPDAVQNVGLALHELFSNAQKWGALSTEDGQVHLRWKVADGEGVKITWKESGGPRVPRPDCMGFGRMMIENVVGKALDGHVDLAFDPKGVRCEIDIPPNQVLPNGDGEPGTPA
ncbi:HWE histidine kinase domain-containing protein [Methyloligella sp. 2.7D]|uniref:HWE histidine kinase domain-containing protein n=1 Tax=unclassified Methyloligella TaxID=2625955 RepID=UPI00157C7DF3|nr:HWE histidine kinase domain-containing protein [Methyloligella sp. GL2]QKP77761.1 PAS domain-containing protein [Methyloligella sp. GL2]